MHHAWLLAGPEGVGKRAFADMAARMVLAGAGNFTAAEAHLAARLMAAGSHPDLLGIERPLRKDGRQGDEIVIVQIRGGKPDKSSTLEQVEYRGIAKLVHNTAGLADWRVVIVDAVDDLNTAAANALLKNLEEPPAQTLFLLVSHVPGRLLPTIRSRCRRLRFGRLSEAETRAVLERALPDANADELRDLSLLADGAPGRAVAFAGLDVGVMSDTLDRLARAEGAAARALAVRLSGAMAGKAAQPRFEALLDIARRRLAAEARGAAGHPALPGLIARWEQAAKLAAEVGPLSLDPAMVAAEMARLVAGAALR